MFHDGSGVLAIRCLSSKKRKELHSEGFHLDSVHSRNVHNDLCGVVFKERLWMAA